MQEHVLGRAEDQPVGPWTTPSTLAPGQELHTLGEEKWAWSRPACVLTLTAILCGWGFPGCSSDG